MEKEKTKLTVVKDEEEEVKELNKPTEEEVAQFKTEFEEAAEKFKATKWQISDNGKFASNDVGMFIQDFMDRFAFWNKNGWMGMIKMAEILKEEMNATTEETGLQLDYQALEFCAYMLSNPGSVGLNAAIEFEKIAEKFSKIGVVIGQKLEDARKELKEVQYLQERWAAGLQGFYLADLEPEKEEKSEEAEKEESTADLKSE